MRKVLDGIFPIQQHEIEHTLNDFHGKIFRELNFSNTEFRYGIIGSSLKKKEPSSDIDLAFSIPKSMDVKKFCLELVDRLNNLGYPSILHSGFNIVSLKFPIYQKKECAKIDLMCGHNFNWIEYAYYSPNIKLGESRYKGAHRAILLNQIATHHKTNIAYFGESDFDGMYVGQIKAFDKYAINNSIGLLSLNCNYIGKKGKLNSHIISSKNLITDKPSECAKLLLGNEYDVEQTLCFEDLFSAITNPKWKHFPKTNDILNSTYNIIVDSELEVPTELISFLSN